MHKAARFSPWIAGLMLAAGCQYENPEASAEKADLAGMQRLTHASTHTASTSTMSAARAGHAAVQLSSGRVLVVGGKGHLTSAEVYQPSQGTWAQTGSMAVGRERASATLLASGKVLVAGGASSVLGATSSAELYDPAAGVFSPAGAMSAPRSGHAAVRLESGEVLVVGGADTAAGGIPLASADLYEPGTNTWSQAGSMSVARFGNTATALAPGKVLVAGGADAFSTHASAELYDPATGTWSSTGSMSVARKGHAAVQLSSGKVLVVGGNNLASAELYDPATGTWSAAGSMAAPRSGAVAVRLLSGRVLVVGGNSGGSPLASTELYDPAANSWSSTIPLDLGRDGLSATLLPTGEVLVAGGRDNNGNALASSIVLYIPGENRPPVARCRDVTKPSEPACGVSDSVNDGSYDPDEGDTFSCVQSPQGPYTPGTHQVTLTCTDASGLSSACEAAVTVVESQVTIVLNGEAQMTLECGPGTYTDPGAQGWDSCGNPLQVHSYNSGDDSAGPGPNPAVEGLYTVSYAAWDFSGRTANAYRYVHVDDRTAPTLRLKGEAHMTHVCGIPWVDPGWEASDVCYGNLDHAVFRTGDVMTHQEGTYTLRYELTDGGGNSAPALTRTVEVVGCL